MAGKNGSKDTGVSVERIKHKDKRVNIPTEELRDFVYDDEASPKKILNPRDASLDPQLVWKGKDEQDQKPLQVPNVPIYIQERVSPQAIIAQVRAQSSKDASLLPLFPDFDQGVDFDTKVDFYHHEENWSNRMILGDSLQVMTSLAEKEGLKGKVQMVFVDPPYGIKFGSNWQVSTRQRDVRDGKAEYLTRQPEQVRAFRDTWKLGIHSYLAYLRDRLTVARELLAESGSIFVQIGEENVQLVRLLMDEALGSKNFCAQIAFKKTSGAGSFAVGTNLLPSVADYLLWYAKDVERVKYRQVYRAKAGDVGTGEYSLMEMPDGSRLRSSGVDTGNNGEGRLFRLDNLTSQTTRVGQTTVFPVSVDGLTVSPGTGGWKTNRDGMARLVTAGRVVARQGSLGYVRYIDDFPAVALNSMWEDTVIAGRPGDKTYVVQTSPKVVERCLLMTTDPGDLLLDPTCGSGTTAYVAEQWGRRWITIDTSRVALALSRTRLMTARYPYYVLADSEEGLEKEAEITGNMPSSPFSRTEHDIKKGFVYRRVPHITLKSIANNPEIDVISERWQEKLGPVRAAISRIVGRQWEAWEVPRETGEDWSNEAKTFLADWWSMRRARQTEIDEAIARNAETELLYDQPYQAPKRVRVTGPFTVESLSPHRVVSTDEELPSSQQDAVQSDNVGQFENVIIENLRTAGVQNTTKGERLKFNRLEPFAGTYIQAEGDYTENGQSKRVAICIGPEHGTVGPELIKDAAKEAVQGVGFDLLVVCGLAFDPHVSEEAKRYGKLTVLIARVNPDLTMGPDLLKKTASANLFMVFGEPDFQPVDKKTGKIVPQKDGKIVVELKGVDVYDPTTGAIRSNSTDDIACWFIDTDYDGESFFVRHAYFTGADQPYERLRQALRAEIDEGAWSALYSTKSVPFDRPNTGKIAVKVINHYGDEVLKVYGVNATQPTRTRAS